MKSDPVEYVQNAFDDAFNETEAERKPVYIESLARRIWAYGLKSIAVFSGITITAGVSEDIAHILGIAVAVAVGLDSLFSNQERMIATTRASQAYKTLLKEVRREHRRELTSILTLKNTDPKKAESELINLVNRLTDQLQKQCLLIENALDEINLKALSALALDSEKSKH